MYKTEYETDGKGAEEHYTEKKVPITLGNMMECLEIIREVKREYEICKCVLNFVHTLCK